MSDDLKRDALAYHAAEPAGKLQILPTKPMATQRDLALAYSPGVAYACEEIAADPATAAIYTGRANLVAVISNGTAVLGLGNIGALASKPVMEGKAALFKKFSGIDVMDIEVDETKVEEFVEAIARLEPTFGGINLEDISAPGLLRDREAAEGADEDPGLPRRPARHGDRHRRRHPERARGHRPQDRRREDRLQRRRRRGDRLPQPAGVVRRARRTTSSSATARA